MKTLFFVRHGEAEYNVLQRVNTHPDVANNLTVTGREQAACCRQELANSADLEVIYCSQFPRTRQTAGIINEHFQVPLLIDPRINETGAFAFEGLPVDRWHAANAPHRAIAEVAGCEPLSEMKRRLLDFLDFLRTVPQTRIAVVSHEEPIQIMTAALRGESDQDALRRPVSHCMPIRLPLVLPETGS